MKSEPNKVSFLVANWNSGQLLHECTQSLLAQTYNNFEVIVVDNGSTDGSEKVPAFHDQRFKLLKLRKNMGFSEANNIAFARSCGDIVALLNNDVELDKEWTSVIVKTIVYHKDVGSVACQLRQKYNPSALDSAGFSLYTCGSVFSWYGYDPEAVDHEQFKLFGPVASAAAYRREALVDSGLFAPEYFAYYEDTDLAFRLNLLGHKCVYAAGAIGLHRGSSTGQRSSSFHRFQLRRNIEFLYFSNMQGSLLWHHLPAHLTYELIALVGMLAQRQGAVWISAKLAAWRMRRWIFKKRKETNDAMIRRGGVRDNLCRTASLFIPMNHIFYERCKHSLLNQKKYQCQKCDRLREKIPVFLSVLANKLKIIYTPKKHRRTKG
jgi:GT2 family glycosyltransferase